MKLNLDIKLVTESIQKRDIHSGGDLCPLLLSKGIVLTSRLNQFTNKAGLQTVILKLVILVPQL